MTTATLGPSAYDQLQARLQAEPHTWLVTGVAGFIGSNLLEALLKLNQRVVGLDNFATGHQRNLDEVQTLVTPTQWANFSFIQGDIRNLEDCQKAMTFDPSLRAQRGNPSQAPDLAPSRHCEQSAAIHAPEPVPALVIASEARQSMPSHPVDYVLHQAALGSVPRSVEDPITTNAANITGHLNMLVAARDAKVKRFVYAASSSTYGDHPALPKVEDTIGKPLSPYAVTKYVNELYADVFGKTYGLQSMGLRYFNVFGPRQDPNGAYAAVIPKWIASMIKGEPIYINGDGETSRDFCFIANVVQANLLAATVPSPVIAIAASHSLLAMTEARQSRGHGSPRPFGSRDDDAGAIIASPSPVIAIAASHSLLAMTEARQSTPPLHATASVIASEARQSMPPPPSPVNQVYNVAVGDRTTLNELFAQIKTHLLPRYPQLQDAKPVYREFRAGDVRHSLADISKAATRLGYAPTQRIGQGLELAMPWYIGQQS